MSLLFMIKVKSGPKKKKKTKAFMVQECDHTHRIVVWRHKADKKKKKKVNHKLKESANTSQR